MKQITQQEKMPSFHRETRVYQQSLLHGYILKFNANSFTKTLAHHTALYRVDTKKKRL